MEIFYEKQWVYNKILIKFTAVFQKVLTALCKSPNRKKSIVRSAHNKNAKINWRFTTDAARIKLKKLYPL